MINVSNAFKQGLENGEKVWIEVDITFSDGTLKRLKDEIMSGNNLFSDCAESSSFPIGCVICKSMTLELDNTSDQWKNYNFYMAKVHAYLKMQTSVASPPVTDELLDENYDPILDQSDIAILTTKAATEDRIETIDKGVYTITTPEQYGEILSFTALDDMYKANATYTSNLTLPQSAETLVRDACKTLGIPFDGTMQHGNLVVSELPESMTFRQLFGWAAMLETANARLDNRGYLQFIRWDFSNVQEDYSAVVDADGNVIFKGGANIDSESFISPTGNWAIDSDGFLTLIESATDTSEKLKDFFTSPTVSSDDIIITGIKLKNRENEAMYGSTGYVLELENDLVTDSDLETVAAQIGDSIIGAKFRSMSGELAYNPLIEFGDMAYTYDRRWNRYITPLTDVSCSVNGKTAVKTQADDPIRGMSKFQSESTKAIVEARRLVKKEKTAREEAVEKLEETLKNSSGLYETSVAQEDGSTITYLHDKPTLAESKNVIKFTAEAIGVSNDGGKTYPYGFFLTGDLIAKILYAHGINADYIDTGALVVRDSDGNIIFQVDMDTKKVIISGDNVVIGDSSLPDKLTKMDNNIASAKNMTLTLSNEYQGITSDADGNIPTFPTVTTTAKVMYGSSDITNDCSYTITKSDSITGSWDVDTHTYTVTGLSADNGWIDIKAVYLQNLSITKRFTVSKVRSGTNGKDGTPGRTYILEPSCNVLKRGSDKVISPNFITFKAYYRDGDSAARVPYKGRFIVEETVDGSAWKTIYISSTDEDTVTHYLYSILTNSSGQAVASSNGSTIGIPRDVTNVRCKLYASGGTTTLMDMQSVAVVIDVDNLTQSQIVEILSNDGAWKGLYYKNGQLYISFSAALGGELTLGGANNGNGKLIARDANGNQIGKWDNTGADLTGTLKTMLSSSAQNVYIKIGAQHIEFIDAAVNNKEPIASIWGTPVVGDTTYIGTASIDIGPNCQFDISGNSWAMLQMYPDDDHTTKIMGNFQVIYGTKSRVAETKNFSDRLLYCYETPTPLFGDLGCGRTNDKGIAIIDIDPIFAETVSADAEYQVFLQKEGSGDIWVEEKEQEYFVVKGTPNLKFSWEIKCMQKGFEHLRLNEESQIPTVSKDITNYEIDSENIINTTLYDYDKEMEELINESS